MNYETVIFDFGGVITSSPFEAFNRLEAEKGVPNSTRQVLTRPLRRKRVPSALNCAAPMCWRGWPVTCGQGWWQRWIV